MSVRELRPPRAPRSCAISSCRGGKTGHSQEEEGPNFKRFQERC